MYVFISAVVSLLLQPFFWLVCLMLGAASFRKPKLKQRLIAASIVVYLLFSNPLLFHTVSNWWEPAPKAMSDLDGPFDYAIVLGGFTRLHAIPNDRLHLNSDPNRFVHAIELYKEGKVDHLVFVSGGTTAVQPAATEAELASDAAIRFGVPPEKITALSTSLNTFQNATEFRDFLSQSDPPPKLLLVTSAFHMRRAEGYFAKVGLKVTTFPTDHRASRNHPDRKLTVKNAIVPDQRALAGWGRIFREWAGISAYWFRSGR